jgi:protein-S-isoprenylcysteine O-methyltransferase Ste14
MQTMWIAIRAIAYTGAFILLWGWIAYQAHLHDVGVWLPRWTGPIGVGLMIGGFALALACVATFIVHGRGTPAPFDAPRRFVAVGPYRWVRNPMYIGGFLVLLGYALCASSPVALLVPFAMLGLAHLFALFYEEPTLETRFGDSYRAYKRTTPRWIPRPPR